MSKENYRFCQEPSNQYIKKLEECGNDPRIVIGKVAIEQSNKSKGGWQPAWDARNPF